MANILMNILRLTTLTLAAALMASCSERGAPADNDQPKGENVIASKDPASEEENDTRPPDDQIGEDCVVFLRSTRTVPTNEPNKECPQCPANEGAEVLKFENLKIDRVTASGSVCEAAVTIHATFHPSKGGEIAGGLISWITPEQRTQYRLGQTPAGEQVYQVKITYRRSGDIWRPVEFDRG